MKTGKSIHNTYEVSKNYISKTILNRIKLQMSYILISLFIANLIKNSATNVAV